MMPRSFDNIARLYHSSSWETLVLVDVIRQIGEAKEANDRHFGTGPVDLHRRDYHDTDTITKLEPPK